MIRNDLVLSPVIDHDGINDDSPIIAWQNLISRTGISADSEEAANPASNLANPASHLLWRSGSTSAQKLTITSIASQTIDSLAIANHNLADIGASIELVGDAGFTWDWDGTRKSTNTALSGSNLIATYSGGGTNYGNVFATDAMASGFWIGEWTITNVVTTTGIGVGNSSVTVTEGTTAWIGHDANGIAVYNDGAVWLNNVSIASGLGTMVDGSRVQVAVDVDKRLIWFKIDDEPWNAQSDANPFTRTGGINMAAVTGTVYFGASQLGSTSAVTVSSLIPIGSQFVPENNKPILFRFDPVILSSLEVRLGASSDVPQIGVMYAGFLLILQRRINTGHTPINYGRRANTVNGMSESGAFLGRIQLSSSLQSAIDLSNIDRAWYREVMEEFVQNAQEFPFFWGWRPKSFPEEIAYCWATDNIIPVNEKKNFMSVSFPIAGIDT